MCSRKEKAPYPVPPGQAGKGMSARGLLSLDLCTQAASAAAFSHLSRTRLSVGVRPVLLLFVHTTRTRDKTKACGYCTPVSVGQQEPLPCCYCCACSLQRWKEASDCEPVIESHAPTMTPSLTCAVQPVLCCAVHQIYQYNADSGTELTQMLPDFSLDTLHSFVAGPNPR